MAVQSTNELLDLVGPAVGDSIAELQVFGVNNLKSVSPSPIDAVGSTVLDASVADRTLRIDAGSYVITFDLQRTGKLVWLATADRARIGQANLPTVRLLLASGAGLDLTEPAKTKRISVHIRRA